MGHIFYFFGLILFLTNLSFLYQYFDYIKIREWFISFQKVTKKIPTVEDFKRGEFEKYKKFNGVEGLNFLWIFFGILTQSWKFFLLLIFFNIAISLVINFIGQFRPISKFINFIKFIIISLSILLLTINHFHLHLDLYSLLFSSFSR
jgi:hypothetical protein